MCNMLHSSAVMICYTVIRSCEKCFESAMASESGPLSVKKSTTVTFGMFVADKMALKFERCVLAADDI